MTKSSPDSNEDSHKSRQSSLPFMPMPALAVLTVIHIVLVGMTELPLGVPGEWTWTRIPSGQLDPVGLLTGLLVLLGYGLVVFKVASRVTSSAEESLPGWGAPLILFAGALILFPMLKTIPGGIYGTAGTTWVTYYPRMSGYFTEATTSEEEIGTFLARYEEEVREGDFLHLGTHPPGLILYFRGLQSLCDAQPWLTKLLLDSETEALSNGLDVLEELAEADGKPFSDVDRAVLILNLWITWLMCAATTIPLFLLSRRLTSQSTAFYIAALWPVVPALAVFAPKSDLMLPLFATMSAWLWVSAVQERSHLRAVLAGIVFWISCLISLAMIVVPVVLFGWSVLRGIFLHGPKDADSSKPFLSHLYRLHPVLMGTVLVTLVVLTVGVSWVFDLNLLSVWRINLANHARFYDHNPRTYWAWLLVNPLELSVALGPMVTVCLICSAWGWRRKMSWNDASVWSLSAVGVWGVLWLSGKNMGEAGRLWIFLYPLLLTAAAPGLQSIRERLSEKGWLRWLIPGGICQSLAAVVIICSLDGFDFSSLL